MNAATAGRAADATITLRAAITEWFSFYNGYDPVFTWWMGMPYKQIDKALEDYAAFLREKVADADIPRHAGDRSRRSSRRRRRSSRRCPI